MIDVIIPTCKTQPEIADLAAEIVRTADISVRVFPTCKPASAAANRNLGLNQASGDIVIMVDDDVCKFPLNWISDLIKPLETEVRCVLVSARLMNADGTPGPMTGEPPPTAGIGLTIATRLPTACIAFHNDGLRFDENFVGSGWEDDDWTAQLRERYPDSLFLINEEVRVVHHNEMKNQCFTKGVGPVPSGNFEKNRAYYESKWGKR